MSAIDHSTLPDLSRADLAERWQACYGTAPPKGISRRLMAGAVAYAEQAKLQGGPSAALQRRLAKLASGAPIAKVAAPPALKTGARLVREWNGVTHVIEVAESGFVWNGVRHRSLSAVARAITGARWSGPRFFGTSA
jgi:hypothetical protein